VRVVEAFVAVSALNFWRKIARFTAHDAVVIECRRMELESFLIAG